jgi:hypothetical protein
MSPHAMSPRRRQLLATASLSALLAACGGGGTDPANDGPSIQTFGAAATAHFVGDRARLTATFSGGQGRVEPGIGAVSSGVPFDIAVLDTTRRYTLVVQAPGGSTVRRELELPVSFRDRYQTLATAFRVQYHAAATLGDGSVLIIGGSRGSSISSDAIDRFDPSTRLFTRFGSLSSGREGHSAVRLAGGGVLVAGGTPSLAVAPSAELIDERTGTVVPAGQFVRTRQGMALVALADGRALVVGGEGRDTVEIWEPATRSFRLVVARMSHARHHPSATLLADGRVLVLGGHHEAQTHVMGEIFDPRNESFTPLIDAMGERRLLHEAHRLSNGQVLAVGGELSEQGRIVPLPGVLRFDPAANTLSVVRQLDRARTVVRSVLLPDDEVLIFGGQTDGERATASAVGVRASGVRPLAPMPAARLFQTVSRLADGRILIVGGNDVNANPVTPVLIYE